MIRLDKFLADSGVGTRTDVKKRIREGRITVNDAVAKKPDLKVDPEQDQILFDHRPVIYEKYSYPFNSEHYNYGNRHYKYIFYQINLYTLTSCQ